jgi:hypothetical protein
LQRHTDGVALQRSPVRYLSPDSTDANVYENVGTPTQTQYNSRLSPGMNPGTFFCTASTYSIPLTGMRAQTSAQLPATLTGPLSFVPAG